MHDKKKGGIKRTALRVTPPPAHPKTYRAHDRNERIGGGVGEHRRELFLSTRLLLRLLRRLPSADGPRRPSVAAVESGQRTSHERKHGFMKEAGGFCVCCVGCGSGEEEWWL